MCMVSMVENYFERSLPPPNLWRPEYLPIVKPLVEELKPLMDKLQEIDTKLGLKDCAREPKDEYIQRLEDRITELEKEVKARRKRSTAAVQTCA